jgi:tRNA uridine 5-carbamoylmethylation protein Kti12
MAGKPLLIAMMGLPRSGKSTISRKLSEKLGAPIVSRDAIRLVLHGERYKPDAEPMVKVMSLYMIKALFKVGHKVVICDETNFSRFARDSIKSPDWDTKFYEVKTMALICKERAHDTGQSDLVKVIDEMVARYEPLEADELKYEGEMNGN